MGVKFQKLAAIYFLIHILWNIVMSITYQFQYVPSRTDLYLLGWPSLALAGITYYLFPIAAESNLSKVQFWLQNIGLPIMVIALMLHESGYTIVDPIIITIGSVITSLGILLFVINVLANVKSTAIQNNTNEHSIQG